MAGDGAHRDRRLAGGVALAAQARLRFLVLLAGNVLWVAWGLHDSAYALVGLQFPLPRLISGASTRTSERMKRALLCPGFLSVSFGASAIPQQAYRVVVPFPAGSSTDIVTRVLAASVSQAVGQQLVVDNKAGADGAIAAADVAKAAPTATRC
jgi:hypothetical protein